jgi:hypothetical protein
MKSIRSGVLLGACLATVTFASAAVPPEAQPTARVPEISYRSAFADYRSFAEEPVTDWRALNEEVARAGGHAGIMRGTNAAAAQQQPKKSSSESVQSAPARGGPDVHRH